MPRQEFEKRLNGLVNREINLAQRQVIIAEKMNKYHSSRTKLEAAIFLQLEALRNYQKKMYTLRTTNEKFRNFIHEIELLIQESKKQLEYLRQESVTGEQQRIEKRNHMLRDMDKLRCIRKLSKIYINTQRLPQTVQGTVIIEKETTNQLVPFKIDPAKHTRESITEELWQKTEESGIVDWNDLIMGFLANNGSGEDKHEAHS